MLRPGQLHAGYDVGFSTQLEVHSGASTLGLARFDLSLHLFNQACCDKLCRDGSDGGRTHACGVGDVDAGQPESYCVYEKKPDSAPDSSAQ